MGRQRAREVDGVKEVGREMGGKWWERGWTERGGEHRKGGRKRGRKLKGKEEQFGEAGRQAGLFFPSRADSLQASKEKCDHAQTQTPCKFAYTVYTHYTGSVYRVRSLHTCLYSVHHTHAIAVHTTLLRRRCTGVASPPHLLTVADPGAPGG